MLGILDALSLSISTAHCQSRIHNMNGQFGLHLGRATLMMGLVFQLSALPAQAALPPNDPGVWTKSSGNPVMNVGASGAWDSVQIYSPAVLFDGSTYRMWYTGNKGTGAYAIGYATSTDGLSWARQGSNAILNPGTAGSWDAGSIRYPTVITDTGMYKMWYTGRDSNSVPRMGYATSSNGVTWTKYASNPVLAPGSAGSWDEKYMAEPTVIKVGSVYMLWYTGANNAGTYAIGYATSTDGTSWTKYSGNPVLSSTNVTDIDHYAYAPRVVYINGVYYMLYSASNWAGTVWEIYYASSTDGIHWMKRGRVIPQGPDGSFDRYSADYGAVIYADNTFKMWYSGLDSNSYYQIGYASAPSITLVSKAFLPIAANGGICNPIFKDSFADYHSGWPILSDNDHEYQYTNGEYRMYIKGINYAYWSTQGTAITSGVMSVDMRFASTGSNDDAGGIVFGLSPTNSSNYYAFIVFRTGANCIYRHSSSGWAGLGCTTGSNFNAYPSTNRLKVEHNGNTITTYINGQPQNTVSDSTYTSSGYVGLYTQSGATAYSADLRFDNLAVYPASCNVQ
jgi:predicted GH43/DUF377 family glycosyl hydrolase